MATWKELAFADQVFIDRVNFSRWFTSDTSGGMVEDREYAISNNIARVTVSGSDYYEDIINEDSYGQGGAGVTNSSGGSDQTGVNTAARKFFIANSVDGVTDDYSYGKHFGSAIMSVPRPNTDHPSHFISATIKQHHDHGTGAGSTSGNETARFRIRLYRAYQKNGAADPGFHEEYRQVHETTFSPAEQEGYHVNIPIVNIEIPLNPTEIANAGDFVNYIMTVTSEVDRYPLNDTSHCTIAADCRFAMYASTDSGLGA
tara:strand:- start:13 stop:786 length:774 start_codon:yes stop_codon:yes gene_type:complete